MSSCVRLGVIILIALTSAITVFAQVDNTSDPLVRVLEAKGILTTVEARSISANASPAEQRDRLAAALRDKGVISSAELEVVRITPAAPEVITITVDYKTNSPKPSSAEPQPTPAKVIAAVAPTRLVGIDVPKPEGLIPDVKLGTGARLKFYGIFKTSFVHDSSSPQGNDFPLPLLASDTGPDISPEFQLRARGLRLGANVEWVDPAPKTTLTGRIEVIMATIRRRRVTRADSAQAGIVAILFLEIFNTSGSSG
ncbi:MAG TPA: hypothetical protein VLE19_04650 [Pyrinomonadaceae bacterium]|nr:hypothetical protein [Pyrinomonadaceae bacterium]